MSAVRGIVSERGLCGRARLLEGCAVYLWRLRRLRDGSLLVLASFYGTPWGIGCERATRNTMLPGETYLNKIQTFFLHSTDGRSFSGPHYVLPGTGAHEYDAAELSDGRLLFVAGDVQGAAQPSSRRAVSVQVLPPSVLSRTAI